MTRKLAAVRHGRGWEVRAGPRKKGVVRVILQSPHPLPGQVRYELLWSLKHGNLLVNEDLVDLVRGRTDGRSLLERTRAVLTRSL